MPPDPIENARPTETPAVAPVMEMTAPAATPEGAAPAPISPLSVPVADAPISPLATPIDETQVGLPIVTAEIVSHAHEISPTVAPIVIATPTAAPSVESTPLLMTTDVLTTSQQITETKLTTVTDFIGDSAQITLTQSTAIIPTDAVSETQPITDRLSLPLTTTAEITLSGALTVNVGDPAVLFVEWQWRRSELADGSLVTPTRPADYTLQVYPDGVVRVQADCNVGEGWWLVTDDKRLEIELTYSLSECSPDSLYRIFAAQLAAATAFTVTDNSLTIAYGDQNDMITLTPAPTIVPEKEAELTWEELRNAAYPLNQTSVVTLTAGEFRQRALPGERAGLVIGLTDWRGYGDLDGDKIGDAAVIIFVEQDDASPSYYLFPVLNRKGIARPREPNFLGHELVVRNLEMGDGRLTVELAAPGQDAAARRLTFAWQDEALKLTEEEEVAIPDAQGQRERPALGVELATGAVQTIITGVIEFDAIHSYIITATADQLMTVTVASPNETLYLSLYGLDDPFVLRSVRQERSAWAGVIPASQPYMISIVSVGERTPYTLTIETNGGRWSNANGAFHHPTLPGMDAIVDSVLDCVVPGDFILVHDDGGDRSETVVAHAGSLHRLAEQGDRLDAPGCTSRKGQTPPAHS